MNLYTIFLLSGRSSGNTYDTLLVFSSFFIGVSLILLAIGIILFYQQKYFITHSKITTGTIIDCNKRYSRDDNQGRFPTYFPIVSYEVNGINYTIESEKGKPDELEIGSGVMVRYFEENPAQSNLVMDNKQTSSVSVFLILGILMFLASVSLFFMNK